MPNPRKSEMTLINFRLTKQAVDMLEERAFARNLPSYGPYLASIVYEELGLTPPRPKKSGRPPKPHGPMLPPHMRPPPKPKPPPPENVVVPKPAPERPDSRYLDEDE